MVKQYHKYKQVTENTNTYYTTTNLIQLVATNEFSKLFGIEFVANDQTNVSFDAIMNYYTDLPENSITETPREIIIDEENVEEGILEKVIEVPSYTFNNNVDYVQFVLNIDGVFEYSYMPKQTVRAGHYITTLKYVLQKLTGNNIHSVELWAKTGGCTASFPVEQSIGYITGQKLGSEVPWDGTVTLEQTFTTIPILNPNIIVEPYISTVENVTAIPYVPNGINQQFGSIDITTEGIELSGFTDNLDITLTDV